MVRAMFSREADFDVFFKNSVVAVGWSEIDFTRYPPAQLEKKLIPEVKSEYYSASASPQAVGRALNQVRRFQNIRAGDYIIVPYWSAIRLAVAEEGTVYDKSAKKLDLSNQRKVTYKYVGKTIKTIPRDELSEALQRRLRVRGNTIADLYEFKEEIDRLFEKDIYTWSAEFEEKEAKLKASFKRKLITNIKDGETNLRTGGLGLEHLVRELFECEGYTAKVLPKTAFKFGDADIQASKPDKFSESKILVQVKHHTGFTNNWGLKQLKEIQKSNEFADHKFALITSADISDELRKAADEQNVVAMDGNELTDWIVEMLPKLKVETKIKLGITSIPQLSE